jgi:serine/threonine protein kinase
VPVEPRIDFERALARSLWEAGVPEAPLQALLAQVESRADLSLAAAVVSRGLAPADLVERSLRSLGAPRPITADPSGGPALADYEVLGVLGQGGMGVVHLVRHRMTNVRYALKRTLPAADPDEHVRLIREAELLARLDHPGLVRVHSADLSGQSPAFVLELLEGGSLQDRLRAGPLPPDEATQIATQIASAVAYLHEQGVLHRDLKPLNVLFDSQGNARLTDFGLARARGAMTLTQTGELLGTPGYMAPEQIMDPRQVDARSDVYALGAILFALLAGRPPFQAGTALATLDQALNRPPPTLQTLLGDNRAEAFEDLCARALAKDPAARPGSAEEFRLALQQALAAPSRTGSRALLALALVGSLAVAFAASLLSPAAPTPTPVESKTPAEPGAAVGSPSPTPSPRATPSGPIPVALEKVEILKNYPHGFDRLRDAVNREQSLLSRLYSNVALAKRDVALIAAVGSGAADVEGWFGTSTRGDSLAKHKRTPREWRGRRWYRTSTRGERRALRGFAKQAESDTEKRHLLWLGALTGDESSWRDLVNYNTLAEGGLERAGAQIVILEATGKNRRIPRPAEERKDFPTLDEARELLQGVLPGLRRRPPQRRAEWDVGALSPKTIGKRIRAVIKRLMASDQTKWLSKSRYTAIGKAFDPKAGPSNPATLFQKGMRTKDLDLYLASAIRGHPSGLGRFVRLALAQTAIGGLPRERALQALVLAVVAFDSPPSDPTPLEPSSAQADRFRNLRSVLKALGLPRERAALVRLQLSLGYEFGEGGLASARRGLPKLPLAEQAWEVLTPLFETCFAIERGEATLDALDGFVPK